ncbi:MAG: polysaccharide biosynthesis protein [Acutalibacteraceae bacterium]|nr:polysaccharide biosynthesis protein [Acutalibacteraceae bacterium]
MNKNNKIQNFEGGAVILLVSAIVVKIIGAIFKIPLQRLIGDLGFGFFSSAYDLFLPIYALSMAGLPIAVSRMTAACMAEKNFREARQTLKIAKLAFLVTGLTGFVLLLCAIIPYAKLTTTSSADALNVGVCVLMISPTVLFCSYMSAYRGYYEGMRNMYPTAVSNIIEALGKLVLGFSFAYIVLKITKNVAFAAAGALAGIMIGTAAAALYLTLRHKITGDPISKEELLQSPESRSGKLVLKALLVIAIPVALSSLANNITLFIDTFMVKWQLKNVMESSWEFISNMYATSIADYNETANKLGREVLTASNMPTFLYGIRGEAYVLYNLIPTLTSTLGVGSVPFLTTVWVEKDMGAVKKTIEKIIRTVSVIAFPAGIGLFAIAPEIMGLLYDGVAPVAIGSSLLRVLGIAAVFAGVSSPIANMLQVIGKPMIPVRNIAIGAALKIVVNFILVGRPEINILGAPIGTALCYIFIFVSNCVCLIKYTGVRFNLVSTLIKPFISAASCGIAAYVAAYLCRVFELGNFMAVIFSVAVAGIIYILVLFGIKTLSREDVEDLPKGKSLAKLLCRIHLLR